MGIPISYTIVSNCSALLQYITCAKGFFTIKLMTCKYKVNMSLYKVKMHAKSLRYWR